MRLLPRLAASALVAISFWFRLKSRRDGTESDRSLWIIDQYAVPPTLTGFTRQFEHALLLKQYGWETTVFATPFDHKSHVLARPASVRRPVIERTEEGVDFVWVYSVPYYRNDWRRYVNMVSFLLSSVSAALFRKAPSAILASSPHLFTGLSGWILAKWHRVPFILEVRDLWPESLVQLGLTNRGVIRILGFLETFLYQRADLIVPLTEGIESGIRKKGFSEQSIVMIPNSALRPKPIDQASRERRREELGWRGKTVAIWVGAHGPANGLDVIVDAARSLDYDKRILFVFIGGGSDKTRLIGSSRGLHNIEFHDPIAKRDVDSYLRAADIGLLVHRDTDAVKGARPNKLFDYMAAGLPIVINMAGEATRLVEAARCGVSVPAEDPESLAKGIQKLHKDLELLAQLGKNGYESVSQAHSRNDAVRDLNLALVEVTDRWRKRQSGR